MKKSISIIAAMAIGFAALAGGEKTPINKEKTVVHWVGKKVTGQHSGFLNVASGYIVVENDEFTGGSFKLDMSSLTVTDLKDAKMNGSLTGHLKSADFFSVEENPYADFIITSVSKLEKLGENGENYSIKGDLTIKGIKNEISFTSKVTVKGHDVTAQANFSIDRTKWNVKYGSGSFFDDLGDKMIYDDIDLNIVLKANDKK
ncbi:MAG: polyisoprenoid-binding protein YceI [Flavobacteriales bacterium]|jgi:polyisoprenoid-binding protein YceI